MWIRYGPHEREAIQNHFESHSPPPRNCMDGDVTSRRDINSTCSKADERILISQQVINKHQKSCNWKYPVGYCWCSVAKLCPTLRPHELHHTRIPCPSLPSGVCSNSCPLSWCCHPTILSSAPSASPAFNLLQHQGLFQWIGSFNQVAKVVELQLQHQSFQRILRFDFLAVQRETVTDFIFFGCYWGTHNSTL